MATSKKVVLAADGLTATVTEAVFSDILMTTFSMDSALTGTYGMIQKVGLAAVGAAVQNNRLGRGYNFLKV